MLGYAGYLVPAFTKTTGAVTNQRLPILPAHRGNVTFCSIPVPHVFPAVGASGLYQTPRCARYAIGTTGTSISYSVSGMAGVPSYGDWGTSMLGSAGYPVPAFTKTARAVTNKRLPIPPAHRGDVTFCSPPVTPAFPAVGASGLYQTPRCARYAFGITSPVLVSSCRGGPLRPPVHYVF